MSQASYKSVSKKKESLVSGGTSHSSAISYRQRLDEDGGWALTEGEKFFDEKSEVHKTLRRICKRLNEMDIPYAVAGGLALFQHGFRRFTEDVDILVTLEGLKLIHKKLCGLGYLPIHAKSKNLRDTQSKVNIDFIIAGGYPGDGKESPVSFPLPEDVSVLKEGISWLDLPTLIELKLASGMTGGIHRAKDITDVLEIMKMLLLPKEFGDKLNPYVQEKYFEMWQELRGSQIRYITVWKNKFLTTEVQSLEEMIESLDGASHTLKEMLKDGVLLDPKGGTGDDYAYLVTTDPEIAKKYDMEDERELFNFDEDDH